MHSTSLRELASNKDLLIGTAVGVRQLQSDQIYRKIIAEQFSIVTPENALKFGKTHPSKGQYDFEQADEIIKFAIENNMKVRGHTLVWGQSLPDWLTKGRFSKDDVKSILEEYIKTVAGKYSGKLIAWDVVNEPFQNGNYNPDNFWYEILGPDYIDLAFRWAGQADPTAKLFLNEWGAEEINYKSDALYSLAKNLLSKNIPLHGIGFQMHRGIGNPHLMDGLPDLRSMKKNFQRFSKLGLEIHVTEMDIQTYGLNGNQREILASQARAYGDIIETVLEVQTVKALVFWGVFDKYSWVPYCFKHPDMAHLYDEEYKPKPAYQAVIRALI